MAINWEKGSIVFAKAYVSDKPTYGRNIQKIARCTAHVGSWAERNLYRAEFEAPVPVFIIGKSLRVVGYREWQGEDVGNIFVPQRHIPVWMVVPMDRNFSYRKPFAVLPEDIEYDRKYARAWHWDLYNKEY